MMRPARAGRCAVAVAVLLALAILPMGRGRAAPRNEANGKLTASLKELHDHIAFMRLEEAETLIEKLARSDPKSRTVVFQRGVLQFYRGHYGEALSTIDSALSGLDAHPRWESMRALVASTHRVTQDFLEVASPDGRYLVLYRRGPDAVLAPHALEILVAADSAIQEALGIRIPGPIRLEIFPSADALAAVSSLTVEQIETTGTIALSKWDRLMITSPRALVRGYPWANTINHELVHMVLSRMTDERAPVWLQEGVAKLLERSWRTRKPGAKLAPSAQALLEEATRKGELLSFDDMHPSIAMLPSQEAAVLAFAEVATFIDHYAKRYGMDALRDALNQITESQDARAALAAAAGMDFPKLERAWKASLPRGTARPGARQLKLRLRGGSGKSDDSLDVLEKDARRFLRLGDLLWDRRRIAAAAIEYGKAHAADREDPIVAARFARAALETGDATRARDAIEPMATLYPDQAAVHAMLGAARLRLGDRAGAALALRDAILINPFDPQPQCDLARSTDEPHVRSRSQSACDKLRP